MFGNIGHAKRMAVPLAAGLAAFALVGSACGSGDKPKSVAEVKSGAPSQGSGGSAKKPSDKDVYGSLLNYSKCMRAHGISNFPDPQPGKGLQVNGNSVGQNTGTYKAADNACKSLMPAAPPGDHPVQDRQVALKHSQCMRAHGVAKFPDPDPNGSANLDGDKIGMAPDNPVFQAAEKACQKYAGGDTQGHGG